MRKRAKKDLNQDEVVSVFRHLGFSVAVTSALGNGFPDIVIAKLGHSYLVEIKNGKLCPSARVLTEDEKKFHAEWKAEIFIVESAEQAINLAVLLSKGET
jgi:Holliday junction resolvase